MTLIRLKKQAFPKGLNEAIDLSFDDKALVRSAIAAGSNWRRRGISANEKHDIEMRVSCMRSMLEVSGKHMAATPEFQNLGSTHKANKSFYMGNTVCALAAMKELRIPWLVDIESLGHGHAMQFRRGNRRPDFIGKDPQGRWYVFESKGRASRPGAGQLLGWKQQAKGISHVNGIPVTYNIVSAAFFNKEGLVEAIWQDPPTDSNGNADTTMQFEEFDFFDAYYRGVLQLLAQDTGQLSSGFGKLAYLERAGAYVGLHADIVEALETKDIPSIMRVAERHEDVGSLGWEEGEVAVFPDGILVKLDTEWCPPALKGRVLRQRISAPSLPKRVSPLGGATNVGQKERATQNRVLELFQERLDYTYLGNWEEEERAMPVEDGQLSAYLTKAGYSDKEVQRALVQFYKAQAIGEGRSLYDANKAAYEMLRYGVKVKTGVGRQIKTVWLINWKEPLKNNFAVAEEVSVKGENKKRPDIVVYVNGIALGVLELKRSSVSVSEGIRQNIDNQKKTFIRNFFTTMQLVMAGNDTEGLRYGTIETQEKYYLTWKEENPAYNPQVDDRDLKYLPGSEYDGVDSPLDLALLRLCDKKRLLEMIHDFTVFDTGTKKTCRHNQYFGVRAGEKRVQQREGGIIWHTQGSGKSLTMVWLAKWIRENITDSRVLIVTDRTELDEQIEGVFLGVGEGIYRTKSGADLIEKLNKPEEWLMCSLVHKFGGSSEKKMDAATEEFIQQMRANIPKDFQAKGNLFVFVDECHRTQSGKLNEAMKEILPNAMFIGFTGTPLLKTDKQTSLEVFGSYIHTYKFDEAVKDGVVLDLRYEARDIDQYVTSQKKVDQWFDLKTRGLSEMARFQLKQRWGTMKKVLSSQSRLEQIVSDILIDMETRPRLLDRRGNAMLVCASIYQACKVFEFISKTDLAGRCAIVTSYQPSAADIKGEDSGEGMNEELRKYDVYRKMLAEFFEEPEDTAMYKVEDFEKKVKERFIKAPGQMRLLIVVDKLLTGFDAPSATYLYIDKEMRDHGLFQAICRVNRLDGDDKEYGYIIDYKDLFQHLECAVDDYTGGALDGYDEEDVAGLLTDRLERGKERLDEAREIIKALCEPVSAPRNTADYLRYFCSGDTMDKEALRRNEPKRVALYKSSAALVRAYANLANELIAAGYTAEEAAQVKAEVEYYAKVREEVSLAAGDTLDMKQYEPAMRRLLDMYIRAEESEVVGEFDELGLIELIVNNGLRALEKLPESIRNDEQLVAEVIENNLRKVIIDEQPVNPKYYERMSEVLDALIEERRKGALDYKVYLEQIKKLAEEALQPGGGTGVKYPTTLNTSAKRALFDNLDGNQELAVQIDEVVRTTKKAKWIGNKRKEKEVENVVREALGPKLKDRLDEIMELLRNQREYQ